MTYAVVTDPSQKPKPGEPIGFRLRSTDPQWQFGMKVVSLLWKPRNQQGAPLDPCPTCHVIHYFGTIHLNLEPGATVIVAKGILESLERVGLESLGLVNEGAVKPPTLGVGVGKSRAEIDNDNRTIRIFGEPGSIGNG